MNASLLYILLRVFAVFVHFDSGTNRFVMANMEYLYVYNTTSYYVCRNYHYTLSLLVITTYYYYSWAGPGPGPALCAGAAVPSARRAGGAVRRGPIREGSAHGVGPGLRPGPAHE